MFASGPSATCGDECAGAEGDSRGFSPTFVNRSPAWGLLPRNVSRLHQFEIGGDVVLEEPVEFRNGHRQLLDTDLRQPLLHQRQCQCVYDLVVQLVDDGADPPDQGSSKPSST